MNKKHYFYFQKEKISYSPEQIENQEEVESFLSKISILNYGNLFIVEDIEDKDGNLDFETGVFNREQILNVFKNECELQSMLKNTEEWSSDLNEREEKLINIVKGSHVFNSQDLNDACFIKTYLFNEKYHGDIISFLLEEGLDNIELVNNLILLNKNLNFQKLLWDLILKSKKRGDKKVYKKTFLSAKVYHENVLKKILNQKTTIKSFINQQVDKREISKSLNSGCLKNNFKMSCFDDLISYLSKLDKEKLIEICKIECYFVIPIFVSIEKFKAINIELLLILVEIFNENIKKRDTYTSIKKPLIKKLKDRIKTNG